MKDRRQDIVNVYKRITAIIFERLSPTFGQRTIGAIAKNVLARQSKKRKVLKHLRISENGMDWAEFEAHLEETTDEDISAGLEAFLDEFFEALSNLIGKLIMGKLFREVVDTVKRGDEK